MRSPTLGLLPDLHKNFSKEFSLELWRRGTFCRHFELEVKEAFDKKLFAIPIYLSVGTEFNAAALSLVCQGFNIFGQHRGHSLYLSFGGKPEALRDELLGLSTGCSGGMSGSNSIQGREIKMVGHSGLMGEQVPIACGAAYASREACLTVCGDASFEEDYIYPSLGWAATHRLPVLFICEDNNLSILTEVAVRRSWKAADVAASVGLPAVDIADDPWLLAHHAQEMCKSLPGFINVHCVRVLWHSGTGNDGPPEWDRYALVKEKMCELGLEKEAEEIEQESAEKAASIWREYL